MNFIKHIFKKNNFNHSGNALLITIFILSGIFVMAFGASYLVLFNIRNATARADAIRADAAAEAGLERIKWEVRNNQTDLFSSCESGMFSGVFSDGSRYTVNCSLAGPTSTVSIIGYYKDSSRVLSAPCLNIREECQNSCGLGSYCGGGILVSTSTRLIVAPSGCANASSSNCSNNFSTVDATIIKWDSLNGSTTDSIDVDDGRINVANLGTTTPETRYQAARLCDDLDVNGFYNWYLPASGELNLILANSNRCTENISGTVAGCQNGSSTNPVVPGFSANTYWSSNDTVSGGVGINFSNGVNDGSLVKSTSYYFRCVRRF